MNIPELTDNPTYGELYKWVEGILSYLEQIKDIKSMTWDEFVVYSESYQNDCLNNHSETVESIFHKVRGNY